jgi:hypothetical protein
MSTVALRAVAHHQDILRNIDTLPIGLGTRERESGAASIT